MRQPHGARPAAAEAESMLGRSHVVAETVSSRSLFDKCRTYTVPDDLRAAGLFTFFRTIESGQDPVVTMGGREMIMLGSNNYLGLTSHPKIKERAIEAVRKYGAGCAGSRLLNGTLDIHVELEERLAVFMKKPACVTFSTGFMVNLGVLSSLAGKGDAIYLDRQDHACIYDGARLAVVDAGMVLPVEVDRVSLTRERGQDAEVDHETRRKRHARRLFHEDGETLFQLDVDVERAVQKAAAGAAGPVFPDGLDRALLDLRMRGQAEVVVRTQHDHLAAAHRDDRVLAGLDGPEEGEEAGGAEVVGNRISPTLVEK